MRTKNPYILRVIRYRLANLLLVLLGIACLSQAALARTAIEIDNGLTLFYERGNLNPVTFAGSVNDVSLVDGNEVLWTADSISIDATGAARGQDWYLNSYQVTNWKVSRKTPTPGTVIRLTSEKVVYRHLALGAVNEGRRSSAGIRTLFGAPRSTTSQIGIVRDNTSYHLSKGDFIVDYVHHHFPGEVQSVKMKYDSAMTTPITVGRSPQGEMTLENFGVRVKGFRLAEQDQALVGQLGITGTLSSDLDILFGTRFEGRQLIVRTGLDLMTDGIGDFNVVYEFATSGNFMDTLAAIGNDGDSVSQSAIIRALGAITNAEFAFRDRGLLEIGYQMMQQNLAAQFPDGISGQPINRNTTQFVIRNILQQSLVQRFPTNARMLFEPIDELIREGGSIVFDFSPARKVPIANLFLLLATPDKAVRDLGLSVTHSP